MSLVLQVVVLTRQRDHAEFFQRLGAANGFAVGLARSLEDAAGVVASGGAQVLVCDYDGPGYSWRDALQLTRGSHQPPALVVLLSRFDATDWMELLRAGAADVVTAPLRAGPVLEALCGAARASHRPSPGFELAPRRWWQRSLWHSLARVWQRR